MVASASNRLRSDCQLVATLEHPPLEDVAAGFSAHSGSETMHSGTASVTRLVGSFWHLLATLSYSNYSNWQNLVSISGARGEGDIPAYQFGTVSVSGSHLTTAVQPVVSSVFTIRVRTEPEHLGHRRDSHAVMLAPHVVSTLRTGRPGRVSVGCSCHFPAPDCRSYPPAALCSIISWLRREGIPFCVTEKIA